MSRATDLVDKIEEIGYYGQHDDYGSKQGTQDQEEYQEPFDDLKLPDNSKDSKGHKDDKRQEKERPRKSAGDKNPGKEVE